jgi:hypothetical protein
MNQYEFMLNGINYLISNESKGTRNGFKHESTLYKKLSKKNLSFITADDSPNQFEFVELEKAKVFYINRTWERFQFESVMKKLIINHFKYLLSVDEFTYKAIYNQLGIESL